ncbi:MAG TPA: hypothetical protein VGB30_00860 [bacterium]|jgi:hypothetical protein
MSQKWIQIADTHYYFKSDRLNWIVARRTKAKDSSSFPDGWKFVDYTYHSTLSNAFKRAFDETVRLSDYQSIDDLLNITEKTYMMLRKQLDRDFDRNPVAV